MEEGPHTIWLDNFSKIYGAKIPSIDIGTWRDCQWTGVAVKKYSGSKRVSMKMMYDDVGECIPAMPDDLFEWVPLLKSMFHVHRIKDDYHMTSMATKWEVNAVPLRPQPSKILNDNWRRALHSDADKLTQMYPKQIIKINIGSNEGFGRIMRKHYEDRSQHIIGMCEVYSSMNVDENIFWKLILVTHTHQSLEFVPPLNILYVLNTCQRYI